jgi:hypothetical protein
MVQPNNASPWWNAAKPGLKFRIIRGCGQYYADPPHPLALLRARGERQCRRPTYDAEKFPPPHDRSQSQKATVSA